MKPKVILITGASSGIGAATARQCCEEGHHVILAGRRAEQLKGLVQQLGSMALHQVCDVTDPLAVRSVVDFAINKFGKIDVLVNNAGTMPLAYIRNGDIETWSNMIDVNLKGVIYGVSAVLPHMINRRSGHIITVSSVAGHIVFPGASVYCATKFAVRAFMEGLRLEEKKVNLRATIISPGAVATELPNSIKDPEMKKFMAPVFNIALDPGAISEAISYAIRQPDDVDVNEIIIRPRAQSI
ncbi:oxidoreductase [Burkholderia sp. ABCPW 11]|uniref:SDR family oxidoreductase n=1 Tax=Burkholderia sp. ABCPW 11 TaxID=1637859 RepID=UPI000754B7EC|nr:SDR family oxidoreductase [Burkholderia sp. ABCPW 11]KVD50237.1 oxidoreductase [Burkholderia sp. ABCPW 11]